MTVLGIETSCDETSVAILNDGKLVSNLVASQDFHADFGGVVPELSSRAHLQILLPLVKQAFLNSGLTLSDIDVIGATAGPGLIGPLLVGFTFGKSLAYTLKKDFVPVNHIEGHIFSGFLMDDPPDFPFLSLVVSGGHTLLLLVKSKSEIVKLGSTIDDAVGEAFDKVAKLIGLKYPGGPEIQRLAKMNKSELIIFPVARLESQFNFSYSGLKTAVLRYIKYELGDPAALSNEQKALVADSFQTAAVKPLVRNIERAVKKFGVKSISIGGGVAANSFLCSRMKLLAEQYKCRLNIPDLKFTGDNAAMISKRAEMVYRSGERFTLEANAFPRLAPDHFITFSD